MAPCKRRGRRGRQLEERAVRPAYRGFGTAVSLEGGYPFRLAKVWGIGPQAQLIYQWVELDDAASRRGARAGCERLRSRGDVMGRPLPVTSASRRCTWRSWGRGTPTASCSRSLRSGQRFSRWSNPDFDAIIDKARRTLDQGERVKLYRQATQLAHDEAPWLFLFHGMDIYGVSRAVADWEQTSDESTSTVMLQTNKTK